MSAPYLHLFKDVFHQPKTAMVRKKEEIMMKKRIATLIAMLLCLVMVLGACGKQEAPAPETEAKTETSAPVAAETNAPETEAEEGPLFDELTELEYWYFCFAPPSDIQHIQDAINEITIPALNIEVHLNILDAGAYIQQMGLMLSSGERVDLMLTGFASASFSALQSLGQLMDITDLVNEYGDNILEIDARTIPATTVNGAIYGIPSYRNNVSSTYIYMRADVLEDLGLTEQARAMKSLDDYIEILEIVKASEKWNYLKPTIYYNGTGPMPQGATTANVFAESDIYNTLGDSLQFIHCDDEGNVSLLMENEVWQEAAAFQRKLNEKGLIHVELGDGATGSCEEAIAANFLFSFMSVAEFGAEETKSAQCGMPIVAVEVCKTKLSPAACTSFAFAVPTTSAEPEAAVAFVNFALTNAEINNLLAWGEEGVDFEVIDGVAQYIPGNEMPSYHLFDYSVPNQFLVYPWGDATADFRERSEADFLSAPSSDFLAFTCDLSELSNEVAAVSNVMEEYKEQVGAGTASEAVLQEFIDKLYSVNVQVIIDEYQKQLDAWMGK